MGMAGLSAQHCCAHKAASRGLDRSTVRCIRGFCCSLRAASTLVSPARVLATYAYRTPPFCPARLEIRPADIHLITPIAELTAAGCDAGFTYYYVQLLAADSSFADLALASRYYAQWSSCSDNSTVATHM